MEKRIFNLLNEIGVQCHLAGRTYLEDAIKYVYENNNIKMLGLYQKIAKQHNTTSSKVERAIRQAIKTTFCRTEPNSINKVFGNTVDFYSGKLPNGAFIYGAVKYLKYND